MEAGLNSERFLFTYRTTPTSNGKSPAELLMNRQPRWRFDEFKRSNHSEVKSFEDNAHLTMEFKHGGAVFTLSFRRADSTWVPGVILSVLSPVNYQVQVEDVVWKRHRNQLRPRSVPLSELKEQSSSPRPTLEQLPRPVMQQRTPDQQQSKHRLQIDQHSKCHLQNDRRATLERILHLCHNHQHSRTCSLSNSVAQQSPVLGQEHSRLTLQNKPRDLVVPSRNQLVSETLEELSDTGLVYFTFMFLEHLRVSFLRN